MRTASIATHQSPAYELCFHSLFCEGHGLAFPCDPKGRVNMDALSNTALNNYLYARAVIGREFAWPSIESADRTSGLHVQCQERRALDAQPIRSRRGDDVDAMDAAFGGSPDRLHFGGASL